MARQARKKSKTGIYHVMLRGNERKPVFIDEDDKNRFVEILIQKKEAAGSLLYAYCLMDNHIHMIVRELETGQSLGMLMKRIGVTYAAYFNKKYQRVGHIFQDRFRSEEIEDEAYLLGVIRYVHQNPVKAGMTQGLNYPWSSYALYSGFHKPAVLLPEIEDITGLFARDRKTAVRLLTEFHQEEEPCTFIDISKTNNRADAEAIVEGYLKGNNITKEDLNKDVNQTAAAALIRALVCKEGISGRQIAELTGINREKVRRIIVSVEPSP